MPDAPRLRAPAELKGPLAAAETDAARRHREPGRLGPGDAGGGYTGAGLRLADERVAMLRTTLRHLRAREAD
jgi:hypothetical protein